MHIDVKFFSAEVIFYRTSKKINPIPNRKLYPYCQNPDYLMKSHYSGVII